MHLFCGRTCFASNLQFLLFQLNLPCQWRRLHLWDFVRFLKGYLKPKPRKTIRNVNTNSIYAIKWQIDCKLYWRRLTILRLQNTGHWHSHVLVNIFPGDKNTCRHDPDQQCDECTLDFSKINVRYCCQWWPSRQVCGVQVWRSQVWVLSPPVNVPTW